MKLCMYYVTSKVQETNDDLSLTNLAHFSQTNILSCRSFAYSFKRHQDCLWTLQCLNAVTINQKSVASACKIHFYVKIHCPPPLFFGFRNDQGKERGEERGEGNACGISMRKDYIFNDTLNILLSVALKLLCYVN